VKHAQAVKVQVGPNETFLLGILMAFVQTRFVGGDDTDIGWMVSSRGGRDYLEFLISWTVRRIFPLVGANGISSDLSRKLVSRVCTVELNDGAAAVCAR